MITARRLLLQGLVMCPLVFSSAALSGASAFEGRIDMNITNSSQSDKPPMGVHYAMKGDKMRFELPADPNAKSDHKGGISMIIDFKKHESITLMESTDKKGNVTKMAIRHAMQDQLDSKTTTTQAAVSPPVATGRSEKIAGYSADEYKATDDKGRVHEIWLAQGLGNFMSANSQALGRNGSTASPAWEAFAREKGFFPMRSVAYDKAGQEISRSEVTKVEKTSLPDSLFSTEGYQEMELPAFNGKSLMRGLLGH